MVVIWGVGTIRQMGVEISFLLGAKRVIVIDNN